MRIYHPTIDDADRFPQAMIEGSSEFDWDELPDHLKDVLRGAAREVNQWAEQRENPIAGEVVADFAADGTFSVQLPQANLAPHIKHLQALAAEHPDYDKGWAL